jgi:type I restriction enzyme S subunit
MRYESYKPSGVAWLGEIPEHWDSKYLGACFSERREKVSDKIFKALSVTKKGIVPQLETAAKSNAGDNRKKVLKGDFVINGRSDRKGSSGISYLDGSVSLINIVLKPKELFLSKYTHYLLRSVPFQEEYYRNGKGIVADLSSTNISEMRKILLPIPPLEEQETIIRYLNFYEHKINKAIATKKKLIATLSEQKQAIIAHAVTKGVDLHVKMKESGIPWLGEIPEHWEVKRGKALFKKINRPVLKDYDVRTTGFTEALKEIGYQGVNKGDLVIHAMDAFAGAVGVSDSDGKCSPVYAICLPIASVVPKYYALIIREMARIQWILALSKGIRERSTDFRFDMFGAQFLPVPPCEEQKAIVEFIEQETATIDKAIKLSKKEIELLEEYKTRLIADVVTGAVDVREEAQNLPEIEEDSTAFESDVFEAQEEEISDE